MCFAYHQIWITYNKLGFFSWWCLKDRVKNNRSVDVVRIHVVDTKLDNLPHWDEELWPVQSRIVSQGISYLRNLLNQYLPRKVFQCIVLNLNWNHLKINLEKNWLKVSIHVYSFGYIYWHTPINFAIEFLAFPCLFCLIKYQ